jgi:hypothetical protein
MRTKIYLTSIIAMSFAMPALAETFPLDGLMKENKTYENAAISTNMAGVSSGTVYANAQYEDTEYPLTAGKYLPANSETVTDCLDGSYCDGSLGSVYYNASTAQGITPCPTGYTHSDANASADTQCYRTCDINNMGTTFTNIAHATAVSGNDYYNTTGTDTCEPTNCDPGYTPKAATPDLMTVIGASEAGAGSVYIDDSNNENSHNNMTASGAGISGKNSFAVSYGNKGILRGTAQCSTRSAADPWVGENGVYVLQSDGHPTTLPDSTGQYCYCHLDSYTASESNTSIALSGPWMYLAADDCMGYCARYCVDVLYFDAYRQFRAALFGLYPASPASCEANTITINWNGTTQTEIDANEAGTATYGGNIRTPRSATPVAGKTFTGWLFSTTAPSGN